MRIWGLNSLKTFKDKKNYCPSVVTTNPWKSNVVKVNERMTLAQKIKLISVSLLHSFNLLPFATSLFLSLSTHIRSTFLHSLHINIFPFLQLPFCNTSFLLTPLFLHISNRAFPLKLSECRDKRSRRHKLCATQNCNDRRTSRLFCACQNSARRSL